MRILCWGNENDCTILMPTERVWIWLLFILIFIFIKNLVLIKANDVTRATTRTNRKRTHRIHVEYTIYVEGSPLTHFLLRLDRVSEWVCRLAKHNSLAYIHSCHYVRLTQDLFFVTWFHANKFVNEGNKIFSLMTVRNNIYCFQNWFLFNYQI